MSGKEDSVFLLRAQGQVNSGRAAAMGDICNSDFVVYAYRSLVDSSFPFYCRIAEIVKAQMSEMFELYKRNFYIRKSRRQHFPS